MSRSIGLIQTRGIGDIIIALPIAYHYHARGYKVHWPVDSNFFPFLQKAAPYVEFIPVDHRKLPASRPELYFMETPRALLQERGCKDIRVLYNAGGGKLLDEKLGKSLKFDEYKYAMCGVPFSEKWNLKLERDLQRERSLYDRLGISGQYICLHRKGSSFQAEIPFLKDLQGEYQLIEIDELTDNPFDWIYTLQHASRLVLLDSCFANLVEQLNLATDKYLILRSVIQVTPVFKNGWKFI